MTTNVSDPTVVPVAIYSPGATLWPLLPNLQSFAVSQRQVYPGQVRNCFNSDYWDLDANSGAVSGSPQWAYQYMTFVQPDYTTLVAQGNLSYSYTVTYADSTLPPTTRGLGEASSIEQLTSAYQGYSLVSYAVDPGRVPASTQLYVSIDVRDLVLHYDETTDGCYTQEQSGSVNTTTCVSPVSVKLTACNLVGCSSSTQSITGTCLAAAPYG